MNLNNDAMLVSLRITAWSGRLYDRQASNHVAVHHDASASAGRYNKRLLPKAAFASMTATMSQIRKTHYEQTLPWDDQGSRLLTVANYERYTVNGGVKPRINGEQRVAEATTCRVERQGIASRQAALRLLHCAPALRVTRRNPLTQLAFMAGSRLPAVNDPLCENTAIQKVNPHILCSPLFGAFGSPSTEGGTRSGIG